MLTNESVRNVEQNVVTDVNANVPAPQGSSKARVLSPEAAALFNKGLVARPLMTPEVCSIQIKNTEYRYRWVNRHSQNGRIYQMRRAQGFVNATLDDVNVLNGDAVADKGEVTAGDVILMKIRADLYDAAIKYNTERALTLQRARGVYLDGASGDVNSEANASRKTIAAEPFSRKAAPFIPTNADALVDDSIKSGRIEAAREQVENIRENIAANAARS